MFNACRKCPLGFPHKEPSESPLAKTRQGQGVQSPGRRQHHTSGNVGGATLLSPTLTPNVETPRDTRLESISSYILPSASAPLNRIDNDNKGGSGACIREGKGGETHACYGGRRRGKPDTWCVRRQGCVALALGGDVAEISRLASQCLELLASQSVTAVNAILE